MEFRKMVMITLYARQQKRHRCIEQSFGLCGRGGGWDDLGEWHWNMYNIIYEIKKKKGASDEEWSGRILNRNLIWLELTCAVWCAY